MGDESNQDGIRQNTQDIINAKQELGARVGVAKVDRRAGGQVDVSFVIQDSSEDNLALTDYLSKPYIGGFLDADGNLIISEVSLSRDSLRSLSEQVTKYQPIATFEMIGEGDKNKRLFITSLSHEAGDQVYRCFDKSGLDKKTKLTYGVGPNFYESAKELRMGDFGDHKCITEFTKDSDFPISTGYEVVLPENVEAFIDTIFTNAETEGHEVLIRNDTVPRYPDHILSATLVTRDSRKLLPREWFHDVGGVILEIEKGAALLCFPYDAHTAKHVTGSNGDSDEFAHLLNQSGREKRVLNGVTVSWSGVTPISVGELHDMSAENKLSPNSHNEVIYDPKDQKVRIRGIINPNESSGWSRLAKVMGVPELKGLPEGSNLY